ncbi:uncharacterized, partial [Tachysurus ichikawai]
MIADGRAFGNNNNYMNMADANGALLAGGDVSSSLLLQQHRTTEPCWLRKSKPRNVFFG